MTSNVVSLQSAELDRGRKDKRTPEQAWAARKAEFLLALHADPALQPTAKSLATVLILRHFWWTTWRCDPSIPTLAEQIGGYGERAVGLGLKALVDRGWFRAKRRPNNTTWYIPLFRDGTAPPDDDKTGRRRVLSARRRCPNELDIPAENPAATAPCGTPGPGGSCGSGPAHSCGSETAPIDGPDPAASDGTDPADPCAPAPHTDAAPSRTKVPTTPVTPVLNPPLPPTPRRHTAADQGGGGDGLDREDGSALDERQSAIDTALNRIAIVPQTARHFWAPIVARWVDQYGGPATLDAVETAVADGASRDTLQPRVVKQLGARQAAGDGADIDPTELASRVAGFMRDFERHWGHGRDAVDALLEQLTAAKQAAGERQPRRGAWEALRGAWFKTRQADATARAAAWQTLAEAAR